MLSFMEQSPSAIPTPKLSIQQDLQRKNVYHIFGKQSQINLRNQKYNVASSQSYTNNKDDQEFFASIRQDLRNCQKPDASEHSVPAEKIQNPKRKLLFSLD